MGRLSFPFMRILSLILALSIFGCNTTKRIENRLNKAFKKHPEKVAAAYSKLFPIKSDSADYVKWKKDILNLVDSLSDLSHPDSALHGSTPGNQYSRISKKEIEKIRERINNIPFVIKADSALIFNLNSRIDKIEAERDKYKDRWRTFFEISLCILILLLLVLLVKK